MTIQETGKAEQRTPDEDVLQLAIADDRAVSTLNRKHFIRLHREQPTHAGIIVCTVDPDFAQQAAGIHSAMEATPDLHVHAMSLRRVPVRRTAVRSDGGACDGGPSRGWHCRLGPARSGQAR